MDRNHFLQTGPRPHTMQSIRGHIQHSIRCIRRCHLYFFGYLAFTPVIGLIYLLLGSVIGWVRLQWRLFT